MANTYGNLGIIYCDENKISLALFFHKRALKKARKIGDIYGVARHDYNLGLCYSIKERYSKMIKHYTNSLNLNIEIGDKESEVFCHTSLARYYVKVKNIDKLEHHLNQTAPLISNSIGLLRQIEYHDILGDYYCLIGKNDMAINSYKKAIDQTKKLRQQNYEEQVKEYENKIQNILHASP